MKVSFAALVMAGALALSAPSNPVHAQGASFLKGQVQGELATVRLAGTRVFNAKTDVIGTISDVVLGADGKASAVIINVGGFAGVGSKQVGVPYSALKVGPVVDGSRVLLLDVTKEQLQAAPTYIATDPGRVERAKQKASEWLKVAKEKASELSKQATEAVKGMGEKTEPAAPAPKQ